MRASSLTNLGVASDYYIDSDYDKVLQLSAVTQQIQQLAPYADAVGVVADDISSVTSVAQAIEDGIVGVFKVDDRVKLDGIEAGATADQTGAEIKALYEAEANTNAYTDTEKTKLAGIETGATADQTGAEIKALYEAQTGKILDNVTRIGLNGTNTVGQMTWNATDQTADLVLSSDVTLQLGQELLARVRNNSGSTITNGTVVMVTGALVASGNMTVSPHDGTRANGRKIAGLVTHDIANGVDGLTLLRGKIRGLDTTGNPVGETWLEGDWLFVKPNDGGKLTKVEPADNELKMPVGIVLNVHANNGTLQIRTTGTDENAFKDWVNTKLAVTEW